jgi:undecaprenyl-diphosphatase
VKKDSSVRASATVLAGLALTALAIILFAWLAEEVLENETARFDSTVREFVHKNSSPHLTAAMRIFSDVGSPAAVVALTVAVGGLFWIRKRRRDAVVLAIVVAGATILDSVLKIGFHRVRPVPYFNITAPTSFSFPSGHAMIAFCFYSAVAYLLSSRVRSLRLRAAIWGVAVLMIGLIGYSRIYLGVHYPTDVIAGYTAGAVWVSAVMIERMRRWGGG